MEHDILKVRIDQQLKALLQQHLDQAKSEQPDATLSSVARNLLREALANRQGRALSTTDAGYREGFARAFAAVRKVINEALHTIAPMD